MTNHTPSAIEEQCVFKLSMCDDSIYIKHLYHAKIVTLASVLHPLWGSNKGVKCEDNLLFNILSKFHTFHYYYGFILVIRCGHMDKNS